MSSLDDIKPRLPAVSAVPVSTLLRVYNLQNVAVADKRQNPYGGKISLDVTTDPSLYNSPLGTPVLTDVTLQGGMYTMQSGQKVFFDSIVLDTVLLTVSQAKKIVVTEIQGYDGTVKEYIGLDDYQVTINGIIAGPNGSYPMDIVNTLHQLAKAPIAIKVTSRYLQNLDINMLVIKDFSYDQEAGGYSKQNFTLNCMSDAPLILQTT